MAPEPDAAVIQAARHALQVTSHEVEA
jgi:hypothetical protein